MRCVAKTECWGAKIYRPRAHSHFHSPLSPYYCRRYLVPWKTFTWDFVHSGQIFFPLSYNCPHRRGKDGLDAREVAWRNQCSKLVSTGSTCNMFTIAALCVISDATEGRARKFKPRLEERFSQDTCPTIILLFFSFFLEFLRWVAIFGHWRGIGHSLTNSNRIALAQCAEKTKT